MSITRSDLRNKIRDKIYDWYINDDTLGAYLSAATTTATVTTGTKFKPGDIIEIESEAIKVTQVDSNTVTLSRGFKGTTDAAHASSTAIYILNAFATREYNDAISAACRALAPYVSEPFTKDVHNYNNYFQLDALDATTGWSALGDATAVSLNTSDEQEGTGCLNLGTTFSTGSAGYTKTLTAVMSASNYEYLNLWIYLDSKLDATDAYNYNPSKFAEVRIGNNSAAYDYVTVGLDEMNEGWTLLNLNLQDFSQSGTWDKNNTDYMAVYFNDNKSITSGNLRMDEWSFTTYPITTNKNRYRLPKNMFRVNKVEIFNGRDTQSHYQENRYEVVDNYIYFREFASANNSSFFENTIQTNRPIQLYGDVMPSVPTADSDTMTLNDRKEELLVLYSANYLFENFGPQRTQFTRISADLNRQSSGVLDVLRVSASIQARYKELMRQFENPGQPVDVDFGQ